MYKITGVASGPIGTNCYSIINDETKEAILIDASGRKEKLLSLIKKNDAKVTTILLTHAHFDHMDGVSGIREEFPDLEVIIGKNDLPLLENPTLNLSLSFIGDPISEHADRTVSDGDTIQLIGLDIKCIEVPGHTVGGMCYYIEMPSSTDSEKVTRLLFDGDTLFHGSIGRSDFPTGDGEALVENIRTKLLCLPADTQVYPGHDSPSTIGWEAANNVYFT